VRVTYLHENGQSYTQNVTVPAQRRRTVYPGSVPAGSFGCHIAVLSGPPIAAERMLYGGPNWTISHAGVGTDQLGTTWRFTEGVNSPAFETYVVLANPSPTPAAVSLTYTRTDGTVVVSSTTVPAGSRVNVWTRGIAGLENTAFRTVVAVTNGVGIVAERATYWPLDGSGSSATQGRSASMAVAGSVDEAPVVQTFDPYAPATAHGPAPRLYERLVGYSSKTGTLPVNLDSGPDTGPPQTGAEAAAAAGALSSTSLTTTTTITVPWYGAHLTGGRRQ
jgi:hypothetical protein